MSSWMMNLILGQIPVWIWPALSGGGVAVYLLSGILSHLPQFTPWHYVLRPLSIVAVLFGVFMYGGAGVTEILQAQIKEQEARIAVAEQKSNDANVQIQTKIVTQTKVIHDTKVVVQKELVADASKIDAECKVDPAAIKDLNDAAKNPLGASK